MTRIKIANITGMALFVDGTKLLPGQSKDVEQSDEIKKRIENGFFKIIEEVKEKKEEPVKEVIKEEPKKEQEPKEVGTMIQVKEQKPTYKKINKNNKR